MRVILLEDIKSLGKRGDVKNVADGYARNFLLPRNLAKPASEAAIRELELQKAKIEGRLEEFKIELQQIEAATAAEPLALQVKVGEKGEVFSSVGAREIKEKLVEKFPKLQPADLEIQADHIREIGRKEVSLSLGQGIEGKITIEVLPSARTES